MNSKLSLIKTSGFSLIELLVAITILAILAAVGAAVYSNVSSSAREESKKADVQSIAKAMELNFNASSNSYPNPIQPTMFAAGKIPAPPDGGTYTVIYSTGNTNYRICAALKGNPGVGNGGGCTTKSATCYCLDASRSSVQTGTGGNGNPSPLLSASLRLQSSSTSIPVNTQFSVQIRARTDAEAASLFSAILNYDQTKLEVLSFNNTGSFLSNWVEQFIDNPNGYLSAIGGYPSPGYQTSGTDSLMTTIVFRALSSGSTSITFDSAQTGIFRNGGNNENILNSSTPLTVSITP